MNFNNYTQKSIEAVQSAQQLAVQNSHQQMEQVKFQLCQRDILTGYIDAQRHRIKLNAAMTEKRVLIFAVIFSGTAKERFHPFEYQLD